MKLGKLIKNIIFAATIIFIVVFHNEIARFVVNTFIYNKNVTIVIERNEYSKSKDYAFVQITDDFIAQDFEHLVNIFYTMLDSGQDSFHFYCSDEYINCQDDIYKYIVNREHDNYLSYINNFVHPYNSYQGVNVSSNDFGKVNVTVNKQYATDKIRYINGEIEKINAEIITEEMSDRDKILAFHDYIINTTVYDKERADNMDDPTFKDSTTHTAYGLLETNRALCGGYTDIMAIFLFKLDINNINITGNNHVWNLVYIDNKWLQLDVTWDDPWNRQWADIVDAVLQHDYFLITTEQLDKINTLEHNFNSDIYQEAK